MSDQGVTQLFCAQQRRICPTVASDSGRVKQSNFQSIPWVTHHSAIQEHKPTILWNSKSEGNEFQVNETVDPNKLHTIILPLGQFLPHVKPYFGVYFLRIFLELR